MKLHSLAAAIAAKQLGLSVVRYCLWQAIGTRRALPPRRGLSQDEEQLFRTVQSDQEGADTGDGDGELAIILVVCHKVM